MSHLKVANTSPVTECYFFPKDTEAVRAAHHGYISLEATINTITSGMGRNVTTILPTYRAKQGGPHHVMFVDVWWTGYHFHEAASVDRVVGQLFYNPLTPAVRPVQRHA